MELRGEWQRLIAMQRSTAGACVIALRLRSLRCGNGRTGVRAASMGRVTLAGADAGRGSAIRLGDYSGENSKEGGMRCNEHCAMYVDVTLAGGVLHMCPVA